MTKAEIAARIADEFELTTKEANSLVNSVFDSITESLKDGDKVTISGFGNFEVKTRQARTGRNPKTGEEIVIPATSAPTFKPAKALKDAVNEEK